METVFVMDLSDRCRTCLSQNDNMVSLFDIYEDDLTLAEILRTCLNSEDELVDGDGLPNHICDSCILTLVKFYNFTVLYEESKKKLQNLLVPTAIETTSADSSVGVESEVETNEDEKGVIQVKSENEVCLLFENTTEELLEVLTNTKNADDPLHDSKIQENFLLDTKEDNKKIIDSETSNEETKIASTASKNQVKYETVTKYECNVCGEVHLFQQSFETHMRVKHKVECVDCKPYATTIQIKKSAPTFDIETCFIDTPCRCKFCHKTYLNVASLRAHIKTHNVHRQYICDICGAGFTRKGYLIDHMESHSDEKKHACKYCGKAYRRRTVLQAHLRAHTHPYHYVCEQCGRAFTNNSSLKTHIMLLHTKERNFHCVICGQNFSLKSTLLKHLRRHEKRETGEREFPCSHCEMRYKDKSSLKRHFEVKHLGKVEVVPCPDCPRKYTTRANLVKHQKLHHPTTVNL